jgi:hypothetical protein
MSESGSTGTAVDRGQQRPEVLELRREEGNDARCPDRRLLAQDEMGDEKVQKPIAARRCADARPCETFVAAVEFECLQGVLLVRLRAINWALFDRGGDMTASPLEANSGLSQDQLLARKDLRSLLGKRLCESQILLQFDIDDRGVRTLQSAWVFTEIALQKGLMDSHALFSPSKMKSPLNFESWPVQY